GLSSSRARCHSRMSPAPRVTLSVNPRRSSMDAPEVRFAVDSPLEESGFELLVALVDAGLFGRNGKEITRVRERCSRIRQSSPEARPEADFGAVAICVGI